MKLSQAQFNGMKKDFAELSGEAGTVEFFANTFYFFGSELATLRLLKAYRNVARADCGYSQNLGKFYFRLETDFGGEFRA
jgi:hypothetical protein